MSNNNLVVTTPVARNLLIRPLVSTSTPCVGKIEDYNPVKKQRRKWLLHSKLDILHEPYESPIVVIPQELQSSGRDLISEPIIGKIPTVDSCRLSETFISSSVNLMDLCNNNSDQDKNNESINLIKNKVDKEVKASISSFQAQEEFKKEINKNKKKKTKTPKRKSPKVCKINDCEKIIVSGREWSKALASDKAKVPSKIIKYQKSSKDKNLCIHKVPHTSPKCRKLKSSQNASKSPKNTNFKVMNNKSPKISKSSPKKIQTATIDLPNQISGDNNKKLSHPSDKTSLKNSQNNVECNNILKVPKCPKSPILHTAVRAAVKQQREEIRKEKEKLLQEYQNKQLEEQRREEEKEIQKLRQQTVFKAKPIRKYAPLPAIKKRPLTDPVSPNFYKRRRLELASDTH